MESLPHEILGIIFSCLGGRSLANSVAVCRLWKDIGEREIVQRKRFVSRIFKCCKSKRNNQDRIENVTEIKKQIVDFLDEIDIIPSAVVFSSCGIFDTIPPLGRKRFLKKIKRNLPKNCVVLGARDAGGIIGEKRLGQPVEIMGECSHKLSVLFIPKAKGVNVDTFQLRGKELKMDEKQWTDKLSHLANKDVKFLFLIGKQRTVEHVDDIWQKISKVLGEQVVVGGGIAKPSLVVNENEVLPMLVGLAIGGQVEASNVVTYEDQYIRDDLNIRKLLLGMEINESPPLLPLACFLSPCVSIESPLVEKESATLRQAFPSIKFFGFFGYGEIGTTISEEQNDGQDCSRVMHYYTVALSVLKLL